MRVLTPACFRLGVALFASVLVGRTHATDCSVTAPTGSWQPDMVYKAAEAGVPKISVPSKADGFNRTLELHGFCHDILFASNQFTCDTSAAGEKRFNAVPNSGLEITYEGKRCELSAIALAKVAGGAQIQFRFETCSAGASTGIIVMPLKKEALMEGSVKKWAERVCKTSIGTTTTLAASQGESFSHTKELAQFLVGKGLCNGEFMSNETAPDDKEECTQACAGTIGIDEEHDTCSGYAFNSKGKSGEMCRLFKGTWTGIKVNSSADFECFNMSLATAAEVSSTPKPDVMSVEGVLTEHLQLKISEAMCGPPQAMSTAQLRAISPPEDAQWCYSAANWFMMEDGNGEAAHFPIEEADWDGLLAMIPAPLNVSASAPSQVVLDRLLVISDGSETENRPVTVWGRMCATADQAGGAGGGGGLFSGGSLASMNMDCHVFGILNAIITGLATPVIAWIAVKLAYTNYLKPKYKQPDDMIDPCSLPIAGILCAVAFFVALLTAIICSQIFNLIAMIFGCAERYLEISILTSAAFLASAVGIIIAVLYLWRTHPKNQANKKKKDKTYLVMEVEEGENGMVATPVYMETNPMHSVAGSESCMASTINGGSMMSMRSVVLTSQSGLGR